MNQTQHLTPQVAKLLVALKGKELKVKEIVEYLKVDMPTINAQQLARILKELGIPKYTRAGKAIFVIG